MSASPTPRIVIIPRRLQFRLVLEFLVLQAVVTGLFALGLFLFTRSELQANLASAHARYRSLAQMLLPIILGLTLFSLALSTALVSFYVAHLSRRVAKPLLHIRAGLEELAQRRFFLRTGIGKGDELWELSSSLTKAEAVLRGDLERLQAESAALVTACETGDHQDARARAVVIQALLQGWESGTP